MNSHARMPPAQLLTFDDISNHFSVPLSDAANNLGVCVSVLKKICRDNGLERWPYRKFLAGKSIEDIKKHAARERNKGLSEMTKAGRQGGSQSKSIANPKLQGATMPHKLQQQGGKDNLIGRQHIMLPQGLSKGVMGTDEFKNGFPSDGLSISTNKWWVSSRPDGNEDTDGDAAETDDEHKLDEMSEDGPNLMGVEVDPGESGQVKGDHGVQGTGLLANLSKRTAEEGRKALKLGIYRNFGVKKMHRKERALLLQIFGSTLPEQWITSA